MARTTHDLASLTILQRKSPTARTKWLPKPGERHPTQTLVCVYARFSSSEQKQRSIERQEGRCGDYIDRRLDGAKYMMFSDPARSGTLLQERPNLMALLELVKTGSVRHIVIEAMDRLTRVIWDATRIGELLEAYGVELHVWNLDRGVSRQELLDEAKRAEADRFRRVELTTDGLYDLIRRGGMPFKCFGYEESDVPGFPVKSVEQAKAVKRAFELTPYHSDAVVATKLSEEGFISPNGTTTWDKWDIARICNNLAYIGVVNFRTTDQETTRLLDEDHEPAFGDISVKMKVIKNHFKRDVEEWVVGYNEERYAIVTDEEFVAADRARTARRRGPGAAERAGQTSVRDPFVNPICDCPGRASSQRFHLTRNNGYEVYQCSQQRGYHGCVSRLGQSNIMVEDVQRVIMSSLRRHALPLCESADFRADFIERVRMRAAEQELRRAQMQRERDDLDAQIDDLLENALKSGFGRDRVAKKVEALEEALRQKESDIVKLPKIDPDTVDVERAAGDLSEAFELVDGHLPFRPESENEAKVASRLRSMIGTVVVRRENVPVGRAEIEVALDVEGFILEPKERTERTWILERQEIRGMRLLKSTEKMSAALDELAASGHYALTDAQWEIVAPHLPNMSKVYRNVTRAMPTRALADACIFKFRTGVDPLRLPRMFGEPNGMRALIGRFVRMGGMTEIITRLGAVDPSWPEGLDVREFEAWSHRKDPVWLFDNDGTKLAATWAAEKRFSLTDAQFRAIEDLIDPGVLEPNKGRQALDARQLIDGIVLKLRSGITWNRMPAPWGKGSDFSRASAALARSGGWGRIVEALRVKFPEILDGLAVDVIDRHGASLDRRKTRNTVINNRGKDNSRGIFANIGTLLRSATTGTDLAVGLSGSRVRLPGRALLRPNVVVGPVDAIVGKIFTQPVIVAQRGHHKGGAQTATTVASYRAAGGLQHILVVSTARMRIDHHQRKGGKWICRVLKADDAVIFEAMNLSLPLREIYAGAEM
ncbi:transposase [Bradyrhizobium algeriense]|uniref:Transposase n=1 Tax=Bradyrhizobium algeriense TaxID=634784 RepID=A0ABU8BNF7_9BRAD